MKVEKRLVCPKCNMGFIGIKKSYEEIEIGRYPTIKFPTEAPKCDRCGANFEIVIDKTLKITIREIGGSF